MGNNGGAKCIIVELRGKGRNTTGATMTESGLEAKVDYWELTVPFAQRHGLLDQFPGGVELRRNRQGDLRGWRGYDHSADLAVGSGLVGWRPDRPDMGCHASLGAEALSLLAGNAEAWSDLPGMVGLVHEELEGRSTRIDIAFDDKVGLLDMRTMYDAFESGDYVSRYRNKPDYFGSLETGGLTLYLGSPRSDSQLVIYDKAKERVTKGHADEVEGLDHWVRVELRLRRDRANAAAKELRERGEQVWSYFAGVLRGMLDFKQRGTSSQKTRWATSPWWDAFLGFAEKARLVVDKKVRTLDDVRSWVVGQVAPSLAVLERGMGFDRAWAFLYQVAQEGHGRLGPRHEQLLRSSLAGEAVA